MPTYVKAGTAVMRSARNRENGLKYQAGQVTLCEDARIGQDAGWDVYDVMSDGQESYAYGFDLSPMPGYVDIDALSQGFDAGNYAAVYISEDLDFAKGNDKEFQENDSEAYRAAYIIGFFSSFHQDEIPSDHIDEWRAAMASHGVAMRDAGYID